MTGSPRPDRAAAAAAYSHPLRRNALEHLQEHEACVADLAALSGVSASKMAYHVNKLAKLGFVKATRVARRSRTPAQYYRATYRVVLGVERAGAAQAA